MLLSPGHSPREISSPSPSIPPSPSPSTQTLTTTSITTSRKRHRAAVLDEDTYVAAIEKIIERDFFPDLPKLRDRLDWLEAVRTGDPVVIRDAQLKILERRATKNQTQTPLDSSRARSTSLFPSESATPFATPSNPNFSGSLNQTLPSQSHSQEGEIDLSLSLDEFLGRYTSEDNESFSKIIEKVNQKKRERYAHLLEGEKEKVEAIEYTKQDRITDGYGTSGQPASTLEGWKYTAKNLLMYHPADRGELPLTLEEQAERLKASTKEINRSNTRFHGKSLSGSKPSTEDEAAAILYAPVAGSTPAGPVPRESDKSLKYDLDDLRKTPIAKAFYVESDKKADNGYSFVKTPSPAPGVDESPIMTWGEIEGTPLRLDLDDDASGTPGRANGPQFNIPLPPARDVKAHLLSREAARKIKDRKNKFAPKPPLPSPSRSGSMSPGVRTLSPAAQKFVRNAMAKSSHTIDENLRASYRGATPVANSPRLRSRFSRDISTGLRSPSAQRGAGSPW